MKKLCLARIKTYIPSDSYGTREQTDIAPVMLRIFSNSARSLSSDHSYEPECGRIWSRPDATRGPLIQAARDGAWGGAALLWCKVPEEEVGQ